MSRPPQPFVNIERLVGKIVGDEPPMAPMLFVDPSTPAGIAPTGWCDRSLPIEPEAPGAARRDV